MPKKTKKPMGWPRRPAHYQKSDPSDKSTRPMDMSEGGDEAEYQMTRTLRDLDDTDRLADPRNLPDKKAEEERIKKSLLERMMKREPTDADKEAGRIKRMKRRR